VAIVIFRWNLQSLLLCGHQVSWSSLDTQLVFLLCILSLVSVGICVYNSSLSVGFLVPGPSGCFGGTIMFVSTPHRIEMSTSLFVSFLQAVTHGGLFCCQQLKILAALLPILLLSPNLSQGCFFPLLTWSHLRPRLLENPRWSPAPLSHPTS
jgi:hypothetical protein